MTIDQAIALLTEAREQIGGHMPVYFETPPEDKESIAGEAEVVETRIERTWYRGFYVRLEV